MNGQNREAKIEGASCEPANLLGFQRADPSMRQKGSTQVQIFFVEGFRIIS